jgi:hypothetical protein
MNMVAGQPAPNPSEPDPASLIDLQTQVPTPPGIVPDDTGPQVLM